MIAWFHGEKQQGMVSLHVKEFVIIMTKEQDIQAEKQIPVISGSGRGFATGHGLFNNTGITYVNIIPLGLRGYGDGNAPGRGSVTDCNDGEGMSRERGFLDCSGGFPS